MHTAKSTVLDLEETAAAWLAKRDAGQWSSADAAAFEAWINAATTHRITFLRLQAAWQQADRLRALRTNTAAALAESAPPVAATKTSRYASKWVQALAASVLLMLASAAAWQFWPSGADMHRTALGGLEAVALADGSNVMLDTDTQIRVAMDNSVRRVNLERGEAFFDIKPDPLRPFVVSVGERRVVVTGTKFSVRRIKDDVRVVVVEGNVRLESQGPAAYAGSATPLKAGNIARSDAGGVLVQSRPLLEVEELLSWRNGFLVFHDTRLDYAVAEFNRYSSRKIVIGNKNIAAMRIGGSFRSTNAEAFVRLVEDGFPVQVERHKYEIVLR